MFFSLRLPSRSKKERSESERRMKKRWTSQSELGMAGTYRDAILQSNLQDRTRNIYKQSAGGCRVLAGMGSGHSILIRPSPAATAVAPGQTAT